MEAKIKKLIKGYRERLDSLFTFYEVENVREIDNVQSRTVAEMLRDIIYDLEQLTKQQ